MTMEETLDTEFSDHDKIAKPIFGYYRQPNGYITVSVTSPMERLRYLEEGYVYLKDYGAFDMTTEYSANHPFELLFIKGGAKEMPEAQVVELGFNIHPPKIPRCRQAISQYHKGHRGACFPTIPVAFPHVTSRESFPCRFSECNRFLEENAFPTLAGRDQHEGLMHKEAKGDIKTGEAIGEAIISGLIQGKVVSAASGNAQVKTTPATISFIDALKSIEFTPEQIKQMSALGIKVKE